MRDRFLDNQAVKACMSKFKHTSSLLSWDLVQCQYMLQGTINNINLGTYFFLTNAKACLGFLIWSLGLLFNISSILLLRVNKPFGNTCHVYLIILCLIDNINLTFGPCFDALQLYFFIDIIQYQIWYDLADFLQRVTKQVQSWLICHLVGQYFTNLTFFRDLNFKHKMLQVLLLSLSLAIVNSTMFWLKHISTHSSPDIITNVLDIWLHLVIAGILPCVTILTLYIASYFSKLYFNYYLVRCNSTDSIKSKDRRGNPSARLFKRLGFAYVICITPIVSMDMVVIHQQRFDISIVVLYQVSQMIYYANNALNFLFFSLSSPQFRQTILLSFVALFSKIKKHRRPRGM